MNPNRGIPVSATIVIVGVATLAGCHSAQNNAAKASASAEASALEHNPKVIAAKKKWQPVVKGCAQGQHWITHPIHSAEYVYSCTTKHLTVAQKSKLKTCTTKALEANGLHHAEAKDVNSITLCAAQAAPNGPNK